MITLFIGIISSTYDLQFSNGTLFSIECPVCQREIQNLSKTKSSYEVKTKCPSCNKVLYKPDLPLDILEIFGNDYLFLDDVVKHKAVIIALERLFRRHGKDWIFENLEELREQASALKYF